jgi:hypothetical protein
MQLLTYVHRMFRRTTLSVESESLFSDHVTIRRLLPQIEFIPDIPERVPVGPSSRLQELPLDVH